MNKRDTLIGFLVVALCGLSATTTGLGLWWIFDKNTELLGLAVAFAAAMTAILQLLIVCFWSLAAGAPTWRRFLIAALIGSFVSLASAGFSAGSYVFAINKTGVETFLTRQASKIVTQPLAGFGNEMRSISSTMLDISNEARQKATSESQYGGSCVGDKPERACGPRCRLRKRHAQEADAFAASSRSLADEATGIIAQLQSDQSRAGLVRAFTAAQNVAHHPDLSKVATWLRQEIHGFNTQFFDPETKRPFVCRDPDMLKTMGDALNLIGKGFDLPSVPPEPVAIGFKDAIGKSYQDAFALASMLLTGKIDPDRYQALAYSFVGYLPALAVELIIIALVFFRALADRDRGDVWNVEDKFAGHSRNLSPEMRKRYRAWIDLILSLMLEDRSGWYFARPIDGAEDPVRRAITAAIILDLPIDHDMRPSIPLKDLYPEWVESRSAIHGGARWFVLHPIAKAKRDWLRKAARDLADGSEQDVPPALPNLKVVGGTTTVQGQPI